MGSMQTFVYFQKAQLVNIHHPNATILQTHTSAPSPEAWEQEMLCANMNRGNLCYCIQAADA